jgi:hypothetical protein
MLGILRILRLKTFSEEWRLFVISERLFEDFFREGFVRKQRLFQ